MKNRGLYSVTLLSLFMALLAACGPGFTGRLFERTIKNNIYLEGENIKGLKESEALQKIENYASEINVEAKDARLDSNKWEVIEDEQPGKRVNVKGTLDTVLNAAEGEKINLRE